MRIPFEIGIKYQHCRKYLQLRIYRISIYSLLNLIIRILLKCRKCEYETKRLQLEPIIIFIVSFKSYITIIRYTICFSKKQMISLSNTVTIILVTTFVEILKALTVFFMKQDFHTNNNHWSELNVKTWRLIYYNKIPFIISL